MDDYVAAVLEYFVSFGTVIAMIWPFLRREYRREAYALRVTVCVCAFAVMAFFLSLFVLTDLSDVYNYFTHTLIYAYIYVVAFACFRLRAPALIFVGFYGVVLMQNARLIAYFADEIVLMAAGVYSTALYFVFRIAASALQWLLLKAFRIYDMDVNQQIFSFRTSFVFIVCGVAVQFFSAFNEYIEAYGHTVYLLYMLCQIAACTVVAFGLTTIIRETLLNAENAILEGLLDEDRAQYETMKENMEVLNIMCHDMKHGLLRGADAEAEETLSQYEAYIQTGNRALDVVLTEKSLTFHQKNIMFTCVADGKALDFMDKGDIYALLGNALDNAAEYLETVEEEKRFADVTLKRSGSFVLLRVENYLERKPEFTEDGYPRSTKTGGGLHGYGTKSIARIAKKYGGEMEIRCEDGMYQLEIAFLEAPQAAA